MNLLALFLRSGKKKFIARSLLVTGLALSNFSLRAGPMDFLKTGRAGDAVQGDAEKVTEQQRRRTERGSDDSDNTASRGNECAATDSTYVISADRSDDLFALELEGGQKLSIKESDALMNSIYSSDEGMGYPGQSQGPVLASATVKGLKPGWEKKLSVIQTDLKYPLIGVEQLFNPQGQLVHSYEAAADHLVVTLPDGVTPATFLERLNCARAVLKIIPQTMFPQTMFERLSRKDVLHPPTYLLHFGLSSPSSMLTMLPLMMDKIRRLFSRQTAEFDLLYRGHRAPDGLGSGREMTSGFVADVRKAKNPSPNTGWNAIDNHENPTDKHGYATRAAIRIVQQANAADQKIKIIDCKWLNERREGFYSDLLSSLHFALHHGVQKYVCHWKWSAPEQRHALNRTFDLIRAQGGEIYSNPREDIFRKAKGSMPTAGQSDAETAKRNQQEVTASQVNREPFGPAEISTIIPAVPDRLVTAWVAAQEDSQKQKEIFEEIWSRIELKQKNCGNDNAEALQEIRRKLQETLHAFIVEERKVALLGDVEEEEPVVNRAYEMEKLSAIAEKIKIADEAVALNEEQRAQETTNPISSDAEVIESRKSDVAPGYKAVVMTVRTKFKYPLIRVEEIIDEKTGVIVDRSEVAAGHFLLKLPAGETPKTFLEKIKKDLPQARLEEIPWSERPLYRFDFSQCQISSHIIAFQGVRDYLLEKFPETAPESDFLYRGRSEPDAEYTAFWTSPQKRGEGSALPPLTTTKPRIITSVLDTGLNPDFEAVRAWRHPEQKNVYGWNAIDGTLFPRDDHGHGTHCAAVIAHDTASIADQMQILSCKWLDQNRCGFYSDAISSIYYAYQHGASILNCSWTFPLMEKRLYLRNAMEDAEKQNAVIVLESTSFGKNEEYFVKHEEQKHAAAKPASAAPHNNLP